MLPDGNLDPQKVKTSSRHGEYMSKSEIPFFVN